jgi:trk system potassium uptake protein TrkA
VDAKLVCRYRSREFTLADADTTLKKGDEVLILTHSKDLGNLAERFVPKNAATEN